MKLIKLSIFLGVALAGKEEDRALKKLGAFDSSWVLVNLCGKQFYTKQISTSKKNYAAAKTACVKVGAQLPDICSSADLDKLVQRYGTGWWVAANDIVTENDWRDFKGDVASGLPWNSGEPNSSGEEDCAEVLKTGLNDQSCNDLLKYICVAEVGWESVSICSQRLVARKFSNSKVSWYDAKKGCESQGARLPDPCTETDINQLVQMFGEDQWWTGYNDIDSEGTFRNSLGNHVQTNSLPWFTNQTTYGDEPNGGLLENCVHAWNSPHDSSDAILLTDRNCRHDSSFGYFCVKDQVELSTCNSNGAGIPDWLVKWPERRGCPYPTCDAKLEIVDAWQGKKGHRGNKKVYGWSAIISFDEEEFDSANGGDGWTALVRLPPGTANGNFQVWNAKFFNFYADESGVYIVIENKWGGWGPKNDRQDKSSFLLVAERTSSSEMPHIIFWDARNRKHQCFASKNARSSETLESFLEDAGKSIDSDVQKISIRHGKIVQAKTVN